jgi:hypothetical protein
MCDGVTTKLTGFYDVEHPSEAFANVISEPFSHFFLFDINLIYIFSKNEHVVLTTFFSDLYVCTVHCANN